jgi:hypothetical protein
MQKQTPLAKTADHRENDETKPNTSMNSRNLHFGFDEMTSIAEQKPARGGRLIRP